MWYKISFPDDAEGASDGLDLIDAFNEFYETELIEHPDNVKGLVMFSGPVFYFHSNSHYHDLTFFRKHGCTISSQPSTLPEFLHGDDKFAESLLENK